MSNTPERPFDPASDAESPEILSADMSSPDEITSLADQLAAAQAERDENYQKYVRALADMDTYRRRVMKEREDDRRFAPLSLVKDLLPNLDNLRRAIDAAKTANRIEDLSKGVDMVLKQVDETLAKHGASPITSVGQPFDPNLHEAVAQAPSADHPPMTVLQEFERGYVLHDRVIRPSKVLVSKEA
ncbi:MAG: nucleotide exchange factor GrpE [Planctomycetota bacterium]|nr:MAG: nucleotide exchange factor GrpE [Planctomycetota bacterium]